MIILYLYYLQIHMTVKVNQNPGSKLLVVQFYSGRFYSGREVKFELLVWLGL